MAPVNREFSTPQGTFALDLYPTPEANLQAWNAADSYLLSALAERQADRPQSQRPSCVVNDAFGALAIAIASCQPGPVISWSDSYLAHAGARANADRNGIDPDRLIALPSLEDPGRYGPLGVVLIRIPKSLAFLRQQLAGIAPAIDNATVVLAGAMTKDVHTNTIEAFSDVIGPTPTSLAWKKARLLLPEPSKRRGELTPAPAFNPAVPVQGGLQLVGAPAVFSSTRLDHGTALLINTLGSDHFSGTAVDLGCGTGAVGLSLAKQNQGLAVTFTDESYQAVGSARASLARSIEVGALDPANAERHRFLVDDVGQQLAAGSADLVAINPPFHNANARTSAIAERMFASAARLLRPGGTLAVVGNRNLGYHARLRNRFADAEVIASDRRFVVVRATKPVL